jgi:hypothetical protein
VVVAVSGLGPACPTRWVQVPEEINHAVPIGEAARVRGAPLGWDARGVGVLRAGAALTLDGRKRALFRTRA